MNRKVVVVVILAFLAGMPVGALMNYWQLRDLARQMKPADRTRVMTEASEKDRRAMESLRKEAMRTAQRMNIIDERESQKEIEGKPSGSAASASTNLNMR